MNPIHLSTSLLADIMLSATWVGFVLFQGSIILLVTLAIWMGAKRMSAATRHLILLAGFLAVLVTFVAQMTNCDPNELAFFDREPGFSNSQDDARLGDSMTPAVPLSSIANSQSFSPDDVGSDSPQPLTNAETRLLPMGEHGPGAHATGGGFAGSVRDALADGIPNQAGSELADLPVGAAGNWNQVTQPNFGNPYGLFPQRLSRLAPWIAGIWIVITSLLLFRLARGFVTLNRMVRLSSPVPANSIPERPKKLIGERFRILFSAEINVLPMAFGIFNPTIIVPADFLDRSITDQETILLHEAAHLKRRDPLTNLLGQLFFALAWFNPVVHLIIRLLRDESEYAADDRVIRAGLSGPDYAASLLAIVRRQTGPWPTTPEVAIGMAQSEDLIKRLGKIVGSRPKRGHVSIRIAMSIASVFSILAISMLALPIQWIGSARVVASDSPVESENISDQPAANIESLTPLMVQDPARNGTITFHGQVVGTDGKPILGCRVSIIRHRVSPTTVDCDEKGNFEIATSGDVRRAKLVASGPDGQLKTLITITRTQIAAFSESDLKLTLEPTLPTKVTVIHDGAPLKGATVVGVSQFMPIVRAESDQEGNAILRAPFSAPLESIWVVDTKNGVAFWYPPGDATTDEIARENQPKEIRLELLPTRTCTVTLVDKNDQPVSGIEVFPYFRIEGDSNRKFFPQLSETYSKTDEQGIATFDWMPAEPANWFIPDIVDRRNFRSRDARDRQDLRAPDQYRRLEFMSIPKRHTVHGRLVGPDGADLSGIQIIGGGGSTLNEEGHAAPFRATTNHNGEFTAEIVRNSSYHIIATGEKWASDVWSGRLTDEAGNQVGDLDIQVYPATPVNVRVTAGTYREPVSKGRVSAIKEIQETSKDINGMQRRFSHRMRVVLPLDENGEAEFGLGNGEWKLESRVGKWTETKEINISDDDPQLVDFYKAWVGENRIKGSVMFQETPDVKNETRPDPSDPADCLITLIDNRYRSDKFSGTTDENGDWSIRADVVENFTAIAFSSDRTWGGIRFVSAPDDLPITIELAPTARLSGILVDNSGTPLAGKEVVQYYEYSRNDRIDYASTLTDENGKFEMRGILPTIRQKLAIKTGPGRFKFVGGETRYLPGEVRPETKLIFIDYEEGDPFQNDRFQKVKKESLPPISLEKQLDRLFRNVDLANMRALVIIHDQSELGQRLGLNIINLDAEKPDNIRTIGNYLPRLYENKQLLVNSDNLSVLNKYGLKLPGPDEAIVNVLDGKGVLLESLVITDLETGLRNARIMLKRHAPKRESARAMYNAALEVAQRDHKKVLFVIGGPRCGPCFMLADWLDTHHATIEKDYVLFKFFPIFHEDGNELAEEIRVDDGGIPWFAILDENGKTLTTSDGLNGNIGFPSGNSDSIDQFMGMLRETRSNITDEELDLMSLSLQPADDR